MTTANVILMDGFDKYGPAAPLGTVLTTAQITALLTGEWNTVGLTSGATVSIVAGLTGRGQAIRFDQGSSNSSFLKRDTGTNYTRAVGGLWFQLPAYPDRQYNMVTFYDNLGAIQGGVGVNSSGQIVLTQNGGATAVATSVAVAVGSTHHVSWDFVCGDTGAFSLYLDNTLVASGTGDFKNTTVGSWRSVQLGVVTGSSTGSAKFIFDNFYVGDDTGTPFLTMPVVDTEFATADSAVQFTVGAAALGSWFPTVTTTNAPGANELYLRKVTAPAGGASITAINALMAATSGAAKFKAVVYADNAGTPNAQSLLASASVDTVGATASTVLTSTLSAPLALTGGTSYWIGFITDTSVAMFVADASTNGVKAANTYTSGAPGTCPTVTTGQNDWCIWGTLTGVNNNTFEVNQQPTPCFYGGDYSYVTSSTVSNEDLYTFANLGASASVIYATSVKAYMRDSDTGARTVTLNTKSSTTDSTGSAAATQPLATYQWMGSYFTTDPNGSIAWTATNLNAAKSGFKVAS
jgi:hypothetical protein